MKLTPEGLTNHSYEERQCSSRWAITLIPYCEQRANLVNVKSSTLSQYDVLEHETSNTPQATQWTYNAIIQKINTNHEDIKSLKNIVHFNLIAPKREINAIHTSATKTAKSWPVICTITHQIFWQTWESHKRKRDRRRVLHNHSHGVSTPRSGVRTRLGYVAK